MFLFYFKQPLMLLMEKESNAMKYVSRNIKFPIDFFEMQ